MKAVQNSKIKLLVKLRLASEAMTSQWHTSKQEIECQRCGRASVTVLGYKVFLSSGQEKKAKLQAKPGQLQMWWLPSAEAVARSSAGTAVEQGHLRAENGVWAWKSRMEILPDRRREKLMLEATARAPECWGGQGLVFTWPELSLQQHCDSQALLGSIVRQWHCTPKIGHTSKVAGRKLVWEFGHVATPACYDQSNS